jgi:hypothetical protein
MLDLWIHKLKKDMDMAIIFTLIIFSNIKGNIFMELKMEMENLSSRMGELYKVLFKIIN